MSAFARTIGVSQPAVSQAVEAGRVTCVERRGRRVWITDAAKAKAEWVANAAKPTKGVRRGARRGSELADGAGGTLAEVQRRVGLERERRMKFDLAVRQGKYLLATEAKREAFDGARIIREGLLNLPARIAPTLAAETDPQRVFAVLDEEIRAALDAVAEALEVAS